MAEHDLLGFASQLSAKLATRSRHVCALLGAGASRACGLPDVAELQTRVAARLGGEDREWFSALLEGRNLEEVLSRLRRIAALAAGDQVIDGLTSAAAAALDLAVCRAIVGELDPANADLGPVRGLAAWAARADYRLPVELFTVNYDLLIEMGLEGLRVPYFDGFVGNLSGRFHPELVEGNPDGAREWVPSFFVRLWKLHGSVNWAWSEDEMVRLGEAVPEGKAAAIYPSDTKYEESRRVPFVVLQDRFRRALNQPETLTLITGYAFADDHLNEMIFDAATRRERSEVIAFCHSTIPDLLAERASTTPNLQVVGGSEAILGGIRRDWKAPGDPPPDLWEGGRCGLGDFKHLAAYLARSATREADWSPQVVMPIEPESPGPSENVSDSPDD